MPLCIGFDHSRRLAQAVTIGFGLLIPAAQAQAPSIRFADQGPTWTADIRARFYAQDQGAQLIPLAWLRALHQPNGRPFLDDQLSRYGYLRNTGAAGQTGLPIGFTEAASARGQMVGMTCAACHVRQITVGRRSYRIDGGPAFADFGAMVADLDDAVHRVLTDASTFKRFAADVLGSRAVDESAAQILRADLDLWWVRYHTIMSRGLPKDRPWGPARLDAIGMIYNRLAGLDLGPPPTYLMPENIQRADAPTRYPFLWNAPRQDYSQWTGFAMNGNDLLALSRNLGQLYGVFGTFHPQATTGSAEMLDRNYLVDNSANFAGLGALEAMLKQLAPPVWPWRVDRPLAMQGEAIFKRPIAQGGCAACHGLKAGEPRPPNLHTLKTPIMDVGTDTRQWRVLLRTVRTGPMEGASVPGVLGPLRQTDLALTLLKAVVVGSLAEVQATTAEARLPKSRADPQDRMKTMIEAMASMPRAQMDGMIKLPMTPAQSAPRTNVYEARVLQGIWAAAPYLHNGSVPTLADLLRPAAQRPTSFKVGPAYDPTTIGLATDQIASSFTLRTTDCADRASGNSVCGHEYGTRLPERDKKALLEYLKTL